MRVYMVCVFTIVVLVGLSYGQQHTIGDMVPKNDRYEVDNFGKKEISFNDFKGKIVLLDFWSIGCSSCIAAFPKLERLQEQFKDDLQIILVTSSKKAQVDKYIALGSFEKPTLPMIMGDTLLKTYFPYRMVPMQVWVDRIGEVKAITNAWYAAEEVLQQVIQGSWPEMEVRRDNMEYVKGRFFLEQGLAHLPKFSSSLSEFIPEIPSYTSIKDSLKNRSIRSFYNYSALKLLQIAYGTETFPNRSVFYNKNRIEFHDVDTTDWVREKEEIDYEQWRRKTYLSYELSLPSKDESLWFGMMQDDLKRYLRVYRGVEVGLEKRKVSGFELYDLASSEVAIGMPKHDTKTVSHFLGTTSLMLALENKFTREDNVFFFNASSRKGYFPIMLDVKDWKDLKAVQQQLKPYRLGLRKCERLMDKLVIRKIM